MSRALEGTTAIVTGAGRGFGRGIATALAAAGCTVVAVGRDPESLAALRADVGAAIVPVTADAADPAVAERLLDQYAPRTLVLNAGVVPLTGPLQDQTWESFSRPWEVDVRQAFNWTRGALLRPLPPGSHVIAFSSGAAIKGSPLSGGYAGAKATVRFIARYAAEESARHALGIRCTAILPALSPATAVGAAGARAYAAQQGVDLATFAANLGPTLTPELVGAAVTDLSVDPAAPAAAYLLTPAGLRALE
jgi:NAD(P)-dependent dehydrogenase (short-subunit alcohol dehydrogenase family)